MPAVMFRVALQLQQCLRARVWTVAAYDASSRRELTLKPGPHR